MQKAATLPEDALVANNQEYIQENQKLEEIKQKLDSYIKDNGLEMELGTAMTDEGLMIRIREKALFPSGSADLVADSQKLAR